MYYHRKRHSRLCLSNKPKLANQRKRRNSVTTVGHFTSWVVEILIFGVLGHLIKTNKVTFPSGEWLFLCVFMPSVNYFVFPAVQAITSEELRKHVFRIQYCKECCLCVNCNLKLCVRNDDVDVGAEEIELSVIQNGNALVTL